MVGEVVKLADRRFLLNAFLPCAVFALAILGFAEGAVGGKATWSQVFSINGIPAIVGALLIAFLAATFLSAQTDHLVRAYEGRWPWLPGRWITPLGRQWHRTRLAGLDPASTEGYHRIHHDYPLPSQPEEVQATRLGNILRNAELYPADRYGIDTAVIWPRLYPLLPETMTASIAAAKADLEFQLVIATLATLFSVTGGVILVVVGTAAWLVQVCFWSAATVAYVSYLGAIGAARRYGTQLKVAVDLYRTTLLEHLGSDSFAALATWWYRNVSPELQEEAPAPPPPAEPEATRGAPLSVVVAAVFVVLAVVLLLVGR